ncbi:MAG: hypothetical protein EBR30_27010 [Cytophagia bacterium]|nr:hypothetical protein [Cytophagia bacterium]
MNNTAADSEAIVKYGGLTNAELLLVYFRFKKYLENLDSNLKDKKISKQVDTPLGKATVIQEIPQEHVDRFMQTDYYKLTKNVVDKLGPIADIILECDDSLQTLVNELR